MQLNQDPNIQLNQEPNIQLIQDPNIQLIQEPNKEQNNESDKGSTKHSIIININDEAKTYFNSITPEEEYPVILDINTNIRYYNLEHVFNTFYPVDSLNIAKNVSREERLNKKIKDPSFTYGEIVY